MEVEELVIGGSGIDLVIASVDDDAERMGDGESQGTDDGMRHVDEFDFEGADLDRKSTRLNSSHLVISYAVFCLKKKKKYNTSRETKTRTTKPCTTDTHIAAR